MGSVSESQARFFTPLRYVQDDIRFGALRSEPGLSTSEDKTHGDRTDQNPYQAPRIASLNVLAL